MENFEALSIEPYRLYPFITIHFYKKIFNRSHRYYDNYAQLVYAISLHMFGIQILIFPGSHLHMLYELHQEKTSFCIRICAFVFVS